MAIDLENGRHDDDDPDAGGEKSGGGKKRGRPSTSQVSGELKKAISDGLAEAAEWLAGRDPELAAKVREGAPRMADFLAHHAARRQRLARALKVIFAKGGPFAALRAFGPTSRAIGDRIGAWREQRAETVDGELVDEHDPTTDPGFPGFRG